MVDCLISIGCAAYFFRYRRKYVPLMWCDSPALVPSGECGAVGRGACILEEQTSVQQLVNATNPTAGPSLTDR